MDTCPIIRFGRLNNKFKRFGGWYQLDLGDEPFQVLSFGFEVMLVVE